MLDVRKIRLILELRETGITNTNVLSAIEKIPREIFISKNLINNLDGEINFNNSKENNAVVNISFKYNGLMK